MFLSMIDKPKYYPKVNLPPYISKLVTQTYRIISAQMNDNIYFMSEQQAISEFNDQKLLTTQGEQPDFKLPKVEPHASRPHAKSKAQKRKNSPTLPTLKKTSQSNLEIGLQIPSKRTLGDRQRDQFALEIEQKLKLVLQKVKQGENLDERSEQEDAEVDFEEAIQHNKERIKQKKAQNQGRKHSIPQKPHSRDGKIQHSNRSKPLKSNKPVDIYEKRMKEASLDNKYLQKKKEIVEKKNEALEKAKHLARQREQDYNNKHVSSIPLPVRFVTRAQNSPKKAPPPPKLQKEQPHPQNNNLFDNIHNLLENPMKNRVHSSSINPQTLKSLQLKLHRLNQKLGVSDTIQTKKNNEQDIGIAHYTALDWKRFVYSDSSNFKCYQDSNFEKQIDKVNKLQQKNQNYLNQYLDHQKMLVQLAFLKKNDPKNASKH